MNAEISQPGNSVINYFKNASSRFVRDYAIIIAIILIAVVFSFTSEYFLNYDNIRNILLQSAPVAVAAIGQAFVITSGEFDLSIGQNVCLTGIIAAYLMKIMGWNPWLAIAIGILAGIAVGVSNGLLTAYVKIPPFIATLGLMNIARGFSKIITNATPIPTLPKEIDFLGRGFIFGSQYGIPISVLIMLGFYVLFMFISRKTRYGRYVYAIGAGSDAAYFAGINVKKYRLLTYMLSGLMAGICGMMLISRLNSASVTNGNAYEFDAIIACVLGGISLSGGRGKIIQALFGTLFVTVFFNGMNLLNVNSFVQDVLKGAVLVAAVGIDVLRKRTRLLRS